MITPPGPCGMSGGEQFRSPELYDKVKNDVDIGKHRQNAESSNGESNYL
jgi:hypothetical protein